MELFDEPRLAEPRFADNQHELAFASLCAVPAARKRAELLIAPYEGRQRPRAASSTAAARTDDAEELDRLGHAFELARALLFSDKKPRNLPLDIRSDEHRARRRPRLERARRCSARRRTPRRSTPRPPVQTRSRCVP